MVEITYQMILSTIQTIALIVGIIYYITIMRNTQKTRELTLESQELTRKAQEQQLETRQAQMFMQIYNQSHNDPSFTKAINQILGIKKIETYEEFKEINRDEKLKEAINRTGMFYEGLGVLVKEGYIDIRLVALLMTGMTRNWWETVYQSWIADGRVKMNFPRMLSESEYLYDELMKYIKEHPELAT
jgi:hypothetical protein